MAWVRYCFIIGGWLLASTSAYANFSACSQYFIRGTPPKISPALPGRQRELCFDSFAILYSGQSKTPVYVVEKLNRAQLLDAKGERRTNRFYEEARLPYADRSQLTDYKDQLQINGTAQRFDRGHMAPAGDMPDARSMAQSFSLSNMVPQASENNRGVWAKQVETSTRNYVMRAAGDVYVFTGPVFAAPLQTLGSGQVWVPKYLFKLVYDPATKRAWAHWVENTNEAKANSPITYAELVRRTGIEFLPEIRPMN